jgi:hypothetical protein
MRLGRGGNNCRNVGLGVHVLDNLEVEEDFLGPSTVTGLLQHVSLPQA